MHTLFFQSILFGCAAHQSKPSNLEIQRISPLLRMQGDWEDQGILRVEDTITDVYSHTTCTAKELNVVACNVQFSEGFDRLDVYRWDPQIQQVEFHSLNTNSGERVSQGIGRWDQAAETLHIEGTSYNDVGEETKPWRQMRTETKISEDERSYTQYFQTVTGEEIRSLEMLSKPHQGTRFDYKLPLELLGDTYQPWLHVSINPQQKTIQGCRAVEKGQCEPQSIPLSEQEIQQYYRYKQSVLPLQGCSSVDPHVHDITVDIEIGEQTFNSAFYHNPNGVKHHHAGDACPDVSEFAKWTFGIWDERNPKE